MNIQLQTKSTVKFPMSFLFTNGSKKKTAEITAHNVTVEGSAV